MGKSAWIEERLAEGKTVYLGTALRLTKVTPRTMRRFTDAGTPLFKVTGGHLLMLEGRHYVNADYCSLRAV